MIQHLTFDELDRLITRIRSILWEEDGAMNADKPWNNDALDQIADALRLAKLGPTCHIPHPVSDGASPTPFTSLPVSEASVVDPVTYKVVAKRGRKPKLRNELQSALETIIKSLPKRGSQHIVFDQVVLLEHSRISSHDLATNVWSFEVGSTSPLSSTRRSCSTRSSALVPSPCSSSRRVPGRKPASAYTARLLHSWVFTRNCSKIGHAGSYSLRMLHAAA